jgi:hypothetical protein
LPETTLNLEPELHARLAQWAQEQQRALPDLIHEILLAAERVRNNCDPTMSFSTRIIRMSRDGGCGLCDNLEPLFAKGKTEAPEEWR